MIPAQVFIVESPSEGNGALTQLMPFNEYAAILPVLETATNRPSPYATPVQVDDAGIVVAVQSTPLYEYAALLLLVDEDTATNMFSPDATLVH